MVLLSLRSSIYLLASRPTALAQNCVKMWVASLLLCLASLGATRDIVFPPVSGIDRTPGQAPILLQSEDNDDDVDLTTDAVGGLTSFGHLPYVPCFAAKTDEDTGSYDIAVLGAPFDTATSYRPGARFGPHGIRDGSRRIRGPHSWNVYSRQNSFEDWAKIVDCGDAPLTFVDNTVALKQLVKAYKVGDPVAILKSDVDHFLDHIWAHGQQRVHRQDASRPDAGRRSYRHTGCSAINH